MLPTIPDKLYFKIGEVAKIADVPTHVLRYWESEFPVIKPKRTNSGQRLYKKQDIAHILKIKNLLHNKGYTISGAKKLLEKKSKTTLKENIKNSFTAQQNASETLQKVQQIKKELEELLILISSF